jgi:hypothetical protein
MIDIGALCYFENQANPHGCSGAVFVQQVSLHETQTDAARRS